MIPGLNPKMMKMAMKKMGIKQEEVDATEVIIKLKDKKLIFRNPQVQKVDAMGQETYSVIGVPEESSLEKFNSEDIKTVSEQAGCSEEEAKKALEETGDIAGAILSLKH